MHACGSIDVCMAKQRRSCNQRLVKKLPICMYERETFLVTPWTATCRHRRGFDPTVEIRVPLLEIKTFKFLISPTPIRVRVSASSSSPSAILLDY